MSCCVRTCKKNKSEDTLFHFPVDIGLQTVWVNILKENNVVDPDWELTEDSQICINHFNNSCCIKTENDVLLTGEAYPSIFEVDDYLIEEIFEDGVGVDSIITSSYEVLNNGEEEESIEMNNSSDTNILDKHITTLHEDLDEALEKNKIEETKKSVGKLKNISMTAKSPGPKSINISTRIENDDDSKQKIPMFKVVPEKPGVKSDKNAGFKIVPDDASAGGTPAKSPKIAPKPSASPAPANKAMQAIQIGNQFYVVSPNTPDGKELTASQLAAIKEKLLKEMNTKGPQLKKQLTISLETPAKKPLKTPNKTPLVKKEPPQKKVTTIDLNRGLPKQLKEIISDKGKKRKLDEEAETFTVSSSLDIMPVAPSKKSKEDTVQMVGQTTKISDFPGNISNRNMNLILPFLTKTKTDEIVEDPDRTEFYKLVQEVNKHLPSMSKNLWSHVYDQNQIAITKTHLAENRPPRQLVSIVIDVYLKVTIYKNSSQLSQKELTELNVSTKEPVKTWTGLKAIIDKLNIIKATDEQSLDFGVVDPNQYNNYINKAISVCKQVVSYERLAVQEHDQKIVSFITEQLSLLNESKEFRRYSINLLVFCYIMYNTSPTVYESLKKVLILPDGSALKEIASADISREFVHASEHRMVTLASRINGFPKKDKVVVLQMYNIKVTGTSSMSNVLMFVAASVCKSFSEVIYFCPTQEALHVNRVGLLTLEIIKRLENIGLQVAAFIAEYNEFTFALFKQLSPQKREKTLSITHPVDKRRKLYFLYENSSIMTAVCWDWMTKEFLFYPPLSMANRAANLQSKIPPAKATFQQVVNFLKKEKVHVFYKHLNVQQISLMNQILNKETVHVDENQKTQFTLNIFQEKVIRSLEISTSKEAGQTGEFMRIIHDWWSVVSANSKRSLYKNKFKLAISEKNKEPIHKLNIISKWVNLWRSQDKNRNKLSNPVFHVLGDNVAVYRQLAESMLRDYNIDQFYLGTFQVSLPADVGFVSTNVTEQCKFNFK